MSLDLIRASVRSELDDNIHLGRLLILMTALDRGKGKSVEGITKLAKLDFLLRYPNCLERALLMANKKPEQAKVDEHERTTIETKMIRFKYGPWDSRYRRWLGLLIARSLTEVFVSGRTVHVRLTPQGFNIAAIIKDHEEFGLLAIRADIIAREFGSKSGTALKDFIYETFPEITSLKWGTEITL